MYHPRAWTQRKVHWPIRYREQQHAVERYHQWEILKEKALKNAPGGRLPEGFKEVNRPPPQPYTVDDTDIMRLSMELSAATLEDVSTEFNLTGLEVVPTAD